MLWFDDSNRIWTKHKIEKKSAKCEERKAIVKDVAELELTSPIISNQPTHM